jgi:hypothetical protein
MSHVPITPPFGAGARRVFWLVLVAIAGCAVLLTVWIKNAIPRPHSGLAAGDSSPEIEAAGWVNGEAPRQVPAAGRIRVMHAWFTTCPACYKESAELVKLHAQYHDQGVEFVGLTYEPPEMLPDVEDFLRRTGITWVNGYGALKTLQQFGVEYFPSIWIIDSAGNILWSLDSKLPLAEAIPLALAGKLVKP